MAMTGDLQEFSLAELLQLMERGSKTGRLSIQTPSGIHRIWLYQGRVIAALGPNPRNGLEDLLAQEDLLSPRVVAKLASLCPVQQPLGVCLKQQGVISSTALAQVFRRQLECNLLSLFGLGAGAFRFDGGGALPYGEMTGLSKGAIVVALEGLRRLEILRQGEDSLPQPDAYLSRVGMALPMIRLSSLEWGVWERTSSSRDLKTIAWLLGEDLLQVRYGAARLIKIGLLEVTEPPIPTVATHPPISQPSPDSDLSPLVPSLSVLQRFSSLLQGLRRSPPPDRPL